MSNSRKWTSDFNAKRDALEAFVKAKAGRSHSKRREAVQRAATMPNRLPPLARSSLIQGEGK